MMHDELSAFEQSVIADFGSLLADPRLWDDPPPSEDLLVATIAAESATLPPAPRSGRARWWSIAAAGLVGAAAAVAVTVLVMRDVEPEPDASTQMEGTDLAPRVEGSADFTAKASGVEIEIHMPGLPRRDGGEYYQLWMHNCSGTAWVPAGTFHDMDYVVAWAGVAAADYPVLSVTEESAGSPWGDDQASSGREVAWGSLVECTT